MSKQLREQLSSLADGELPRDQLRFLLRGIDVNAQLAQSWTHYQIAGAALRRQTLPPLRADFVETVMVRIDDRVTAAARPGARILRWAGGGALAAAVAVVALVATRPGDLQPPAISTTLAAVPATPAPAPINLRAPITPPLPIVADFDYAQPASFDVGVTPLPRYDVSYRYGSRAVQPLNGLVPYALLVAPVRAQQSVRSPSPLHAAHQ